MTPSQMLAVLIADSGLSVQDYAQWRMAGRTAKTLGYWLRGPIPSDVARWIAREYENRPYAEARPLREGASRP